MPGRRTRWQGSEARRLEQIRPAPALVGGALGILGPGVLATSRLSDLYHARTTLVLIWQETRAIFGALLLAGLLVTATGIVLLGPAMYADPALGTVVAWLTTVLGAAAIAAGTAVLIDPASPAAAIGIFALIGFHFVLGWKIYRLSTVVSSTHDQ